MDRRRFLESLVTAPIAWSLARNLPASELAGRRIVVVGAGAFGGWTALALQRAGAQVTLVESWAAGHPRSSSGGETRVIRHLYDSPRYVRMAARALKLWREAAANWQQPLFHPTGVLFLARPGHDDYHRAAAKALEEEGIDFERLDTEQLAQRFPQINPDGIDYGLFEPDTGYLLARRACHAVSEAVIAGGGDYRIGRARPGRISGERLVDIELDNGDRVGADAFVFACGPWLQSLFPELFEQALRITRQEVYYFGTPAGDRRHGESSLPVWADFGERLWYGIPGSERRGFKIADDTRGPVFDPVASDRTPGAEGIDAARAYLAQRFPALADAPLVEARVCQYTNTDDGDFIVDHHPEAANLWLLGGGNGHGFKHAPAVGEVAAEAVLAGRTPVAEFRLDRFKA